MPPRDTVIVGGGIVGLATAWCLLEQRPGTRLTLVDKEPTLAAHQTSRNSGVLHSGIYYKPGSLKAINCREGKLAMERFCLAEGIPFDLCGKVIVATHEQELPLLQRILERGQANGVRCEAIGPERLREIEPHASGIRAIHVPETGIIEYRLVCEKLAEKIRAQGGEILLNTTALHLHQQQDGLTLATSQGDLACRTAVNCGGLHSDRIAAWTHPPQARIIPFRGEYYEVLPEARHLCRHLIYPVPDPAFPFLGVHFTRMMRGGVECGPNAVLALAREGYRKTDIHWRDLSEILRYRGFQRLALKHWQMGLGEFWRSCSKQAFVRALQRLVPEIEAKDLHPAPAGIRAQAVSPDGTTVDDFLIQETPRIIHICNAPSPAATAALNIGKLIASKLLTRL